MCTLYCCKALPSTVWMAPQQVVIMMMMMSHLVLAVARLVQIELGHHSWCGWEKASRDGGTTGFADRATSKQPSGFWWFIPSQSTWKEDRWCERKWGRWRGRKARRYNQLRSHRQFNIDNLSVCRLRIIHWTTDDRAVILPRIENETDYIREIRWGTAVDQAGILAAGRCEFLSSFDRLFIPRTL